MSESRSSTASKLNAVLARWHFIRATFHRHWGNLGSGRAAYQRAVDQFTRAVALNPRFTEAYLQRGILYWREIQNYHHAIRDLSRVLDLDPQRTTALYLRALAYQLRGDFDQAIDDLQRFLEADPDSTWRPSAEVQLSGLHELRAARQAMRKP